MLKKLLRAPLPEQIVALLEKLEQDPDASHLVKVDNLMDNSRTEFTWYEKRVIKHELNKMRNVIRRAQTLDDVMRIVINEPTLAEQAEQEWTQAQLQAQLGRSTGTISGTLGQHAAAQRVSIAHIHAHQQLMNQAQWYASGYTDPRAVLMNGNSQ
jgi:hypothetical protein